MPHYLVSLAHGPAWDDALPRREQSGWAEHAAFMDELVARGVVVLGGPLGADPDAGDALLLVRADDESAAALAFTADPWHGTILRTRSVLAWNLWLGAPEAREDPAE